MRALEQTRKFGTAPVFFTAISTILGAIMFLRFGFAVGQVGFLGALAIVLIGHAVTIPTALAIAEIATNQKVEGGGEYYIISRSFGLVIGSTIGIALYLSQAISVAFYVMAFSEAFTPLIDYLVQAFAMPAWLVWLLQQKQTFGIPALMVLTYIILARGADLGVKALYVVVATLTISLLAFFAGKTEYSKTHDFDPIHTLAEAIQKEGPEEKTYIPPSIPMDTLRGDSIAGGFDSSRTDQVLRPSTPPEKSSEELPFLPIGFFTVFAIIFPAFTGMTAGVGLSGDLKDPGRSLPLGTISATLVGMITYVFIAYKLAASASPMDLADTSRLVMADIAWQGSWIIPLGLAAATISSALGSILIAPRTMQAIAKDKVMPLPRFNAWLSRGKGETNEPFNASLVTVMIAAVFILAGALDNVAKIISMFFMVTYGSLCLISFLNHFAADPSYRPRFRSRWYLSLFGAIACFGLMFLMNPGYAFLAISLMVILYFGVAHFNKDKKSMALIFQGVIFQFSRQLQVFLQKADKEKASSWRPSVVAISVHSFDRLGAFDLLRWIAQKYGFGTYIHHIEGYLSRDTHKQAEASKKRLIEMTELTQSNIYVDTLVNPSYTASIAQVIQLPGIAGTENNLLLFEFSKNEPDGLNEIVENFNLIKSVEFDVLVLATTERGFGMRKQIHIWITENDYQNANLMILLSYVIIGHREWKGAEIKIFAIYPEEGINREKERLYYLIEMGQLPISPNNVEFIVHKTDTRTDEVIRAKSRDADLTMVGLYPEVIRHQGASSFGGFDSIGNVLYVYAIEAKEIK